jgi:hypothetical protein
MLIRNSRTWTASYVGGAALLTLVVWLAAGHSLQSLVISVVSMGGAAVVGWLVPRRPVAAFGVLFVLASLTRPTLQLPIGSMRVEQPAIAAALIAIALSRRWPSRQSMRAALAVAGAFAVYLASLAASSLLEAPNREDSLRLVIWTALSMLGGLAAFCLLTNRAAQAARWFRTAGGLAAATGIAAALLFLVLGPVITREADPAPGIQNAMSSIPKVYGYAWEANLYASFLGAMAPFAIEAFRARRTVRSGAVVALMLLGFALGFTRGAYVGLGAGLITYAAIVIWRSRSVRDLLAPAALAIVVLAIGSTVWASVMLPTGRPANAPLDTRVAAALSHGGEAPSATPRPSAAPTVQPPPPPDTLLFRLDHVPIAIDDLSHSPIIGLGANSYGQRHLDVTQHNQPDHLAMMAVAVLYESGVVGALGLAIGFLALLWLLLRTSAIQDRRGAAAAYMAAIVVFLVAYQATNAIHFAINWLIVGGALALALGREATVEAS